MPQKIPINRNDVKCNFALKMLLVVYDVQVDSGYHSF